MSGATGEPRVLEPAPGILAFYEGRIEGARFDPEPNWVDEGALGLGIAGYAILADDEAVVYDTGVSVEYASFVRAALNRRGATRFTVLLSHWHLDHVAGTAAFADCEVLAGARTVEQLRTRREAIEAGTLEGPPAIAPLVLPTRTLADGERLRVGDTVIETIAVNIHSDDATVLWLPEQHLLLAGDTMEDTVTYVDEPGSFDIHLRDLDRLHALHPDRILPAHGDPDQIGGGGYPAGFNDATQAYIRLLQRMPTEPQLRELPLRDLIADSLAAGDLIYFEPYEAVHRQNMETVLTSAERT
jgi:glyoxylase-like metal-dependent hydrolase (beta-lactamase superfamily II)